MRRELVMHFILRVIVHCDRVMRLQNIPAIQYIAMVKTGGSDEVHMSRGKIDDSQPGQLNRQLI